MNQTPNGPTGALYLPPGNGGSASIIQSNSIWVDPNGSDSIGNGTLGNPYQTIANAIAKAKAKSPSATNRIAVMIAPGVYNETSINIPPWVWLIGLHPITDTGTERIHLVSGTLGLDTAAFITASNTTNGNCCGMSSIQISPNCNFVATGLNAANPDIEITIDHCLFFGSITATFQDVGSYLSINYIESVGAINVTQGGGQILNGVIASSITWALGGSTFFQNTQCTDMTLSQATGVTSGDPVQISACNIPSLSISGTGLVVTADAVSIPLIADMSISGGASLVRSTDSGGVAYVPTTSGNWPTQPSGALQDAIDKLAARLHALGG